MDEALLWREQMLEAVCEINEDAMALVMEDEEVPVELVRAALRQGCLEQTIQPVLCGSALHGDWCSTTHDRRWAITFLARSIDRL